MAELSRITSDVHIAGHLTSRTQGYPSGSIANDAISGSAGIAATKMQHQYSQSYSQEAGTTTAADEQAMHIVWGATGTVVAFEAGSVTACTVDATITVDLHNDGASILTTPIVLDNGNAVYTPEEASIDTAAVVDGDVLAVVVTVDAAAGVLGNGLFASLIVREDAV